MSPRPWREEEDKNREERNADGRGNPAGSAFGPTPTLLGTHMRLSIPAQSSGLCLSVDPDIIRLLELAFAISILNAVQIERAMHLGHPWVSKSPPML